MQRETSHKISCEEQAANNILQNNIFKKIYFR